MALFADNAVYTWGSYFTSQDKVMIRNWLEYGVALHAQTKVTDCKPTGPTVTCEWRFVNDCFGTGNTDRYDMKGKIVFAVSDGKITNFGFTDDLGPEYSQWEQDFFTWLAGAYPTETILQTLGDKKFSREFGQHLSKFCTEHGALKATPAASSDPAAPVKAWVDAMNSGDVDAALAPFADDVQYHFVFDATGKQQLRGVVDWLVGIQSKFKISDCEQPQSDRVACTFANSDGCIAPYGAVESLASKGVYIFGEDGKIKQVIGATEGAEWDSYWKWVDAEQAWQKANRAEEASKVESSPPKEGGAIQIKLCKEYAESLKATPTLAPSSDAEKLVMAFQDAFNKRDLDAALALFVDDGLNYMSGGSTFHNKQRLRDWLEVGVGYGETDEFVACAPYGKGLRCTVLVRSTCLKASCGLDVYHTEVTVMTKDGKIQLMSFQDGDVSAQDQKACAEAWPKYQAWAEANRANEWKKLNASVAYDLKGRPLGELASSVCKAYLDSQESATVSTAAAKLVLLVAQEQSEDMELMLTKEVGVMVSVLEKAGYKVVVASATGQPITGGATTLKPDMKLADVKVDDYVGFVFPCMAVPLDPPRPPAEALEIAKKAVVQGKPVAAQVGGVVLLGMAGVLDGKQFALFDELASLVPKGIYKGDGVVQDGNIVTSGICPYKAKMMGRTDGTSELTQKFIDALAASQK